MNGDFKINNCLNLESQDYSGCQIQGAAAYWSALFIDGAGLDPFSVQTGTLFKYFSTVTTSRVVPLDVYDYKFGAASANHYRRTCLKQDLGLLSEGYYTLGLNAATRNNQTILNQAKCYDFYAYIQNSDGTQVTMPKAEWINGESFGSKAISYDFVNYGQKSGQTFYICSSRCFWSDRNYYTQTDPTHATGVSDISLKIVKTVDSLTGAKALNTNLIKNGDFKINNCLNNENQDYTGCQIQGAAPYWSASFIDGAGLAPFPIHQQELFP
jgi:hypothetical protein